MAVMQSPQRLYPALATTSSSDRYNTTNTYRNIMQPTNSIFSTFDDTFLHARAAQAALVEMDMKNVNATGMLRPSDMFGFGNYHTTAPTSSSNGQHSMNGMNGEFDSSVNNNSLMSSSSMLMDGSMMMQQAASDSMASLQQVMAMHHPYQTHPHQFAQYPTINPHFAAAAVVSSQPGNGGLQLPSSATAASVAMSRYPLNVPNPEVDTDPRELERFAEHFKQRRIKLGVTQADVGKALAHLKMPGVGSLSQSTICRFESLTLSHNNMVALKPILHSWLEKAEEAIKNKDLTSDAQGILPNSEKKRKRTSIAAPEKRCLEEFFRQQPRPTGDKIASIADKLDLKKNVVRVWFCNQRQKQKRNQAGNNTNNNSHNSSSNVNGSGNNNSILDPVSVMKCTPFSDLSSIETAAAAAAASAIVSASNNNNSTSNENNSGKNQVMPNLGLFY
uniref:POU domain protein n=1 Tax=Parastrongyloides trichosuri TaxID=131310 RepID=A0A0N5A590_PARTI